MLSKPRRAAAANRSIDPTAPEAYEATKGASMDDPTLPEVADILRASSRQEPPTASGSIYEVLVTGQRPPPQHGETYHRFDERDEREDGPYSSQVWVDSLTKLPLKGVTASEADPSQVHSTYYSYSGNRLTRADLPDEFFSVARPANTTTETSVTSHGSGAVGTREDVETRRSFTPYSLGPFPAILTSRFCLGSADTVRLNASESQANEEPDPDAGESDPRAPESFVDATYRPLADEEACSPGQNDVSTPSLEVISYASESTTGSGWHADYEATATKIQSDPTDPDFDRAGILPVTIAGRMTTAYLVPRDDDTMSAAIKLDGTVLLVSGPFTKMTAQLLFSQLVPA